MREFVCTVIEVLPDGDWRLLWRHKFAVAGNSDPRDRKKMAAIAERLERQLNEAVDDVDEVKHGL